MFALISIFEVSRGMWIYHTLAYSVKNGIRYASVHGIDCFNTANNPNDCLVEMGPANTPGTIAYVSVKRPWGWTRKHYTDLYGRWWGGHQLYPGDRFLSGDRMAAKRPQWPQQP